MASTRSGRRPPTTRATPDPSSLSNLECLLLAQVVHELGASAWPAVSRLLTRHPLISRPKSFFTAQSCHTIYEYLMKEAELTCTEANNAARAAVNLQLAQKYYRKRMVELYQLIADEEAKFQQIASEIDDIRAGKWDDKLRAEVTGEYQPDAAYPPELDVTIPPLQEPFGDSELSGITESGSPSREDAAKLTVPTDSAQELKAYESPVLEPQEGDAIPTPKIPPGDLNLHKIAGSASIFVADEQNPPPEKNATSEGEIAEAPADINVAEEAADCVETEAEAEGIEVDDRYGGDSSQEDLEQASPAVVSRSHESKRKAGIVEDSARDKKRLRDASELPDDDEPGPSSSSTRRRRDRDKTDQMAIKRFQNVIGMLHSQISQHRNGNIFHNPIRNSEAPDYREIVKRPMDLKTIKTRIKDGVISNSLEFQRDVYLMFANALMYNRPGSDIYHMTEEMMLQSEMEINQFRQTEGFMRGARI